MIRLVLIWLFLALPLRAEDLPALYAVTGVARDDVLNIRARPDAGSEIIGSFAPDATGIEVLASSGGWGLVNTGEGSGYVALRFLSREERPDWSTLEVPLTCLGTEPFWSLEIDPMAGTTRYLTPDDQSPPTEPITALWPAEPWAQSVAVGLADGLAVMTGAECSDGMSDRAYRIAVDIFRLGPGGSSRVSGCCRLGQD